jgi:DNA-binding LacI/PurR family transcriptional regulator
MKTILFPRLALLAGVLSLTGATALLAQDDTNAPPAPAEHHHGGFLTADQRAELKKDRDAVFADNPELKTEEENLRQQMKAHADKMNAAIVAKDPAAAPLLAKMHGHHGPPPPDEQ